MSQERRKGVRRNSASSATLRLKLLQGILKFSHRAAEVTAQIPAKISVFSVALCDFFFAFSAGR